jgi:hypothetical protein
MWHTIVCAVTEPVHASVLPDTLVLRALEIHIHNASSLKVRAARDVARAVRTALKVAVGI